MLGGRYFFIKLLSSNYKFEVITYFIKIMTCDVGFSLISLYLPLYTYIGCLVLLSILVSR